MGTEISLDIGGLSIDWSKNARGAAHGVLFQESDRKRLRSEQIDYDYFADSGEDPGPTEMALARRLKHVVPRLELLGFTLDAAKAEYLVVAQSWLEERHDLADDAEPPDVMSFEESFAARGPEGVRAPDINRRAAAIECYLDLLLEGYPPANVVWTNYERELGTYQGVLEYKDAYTKAFLKLTPEILAAGGYDVSKIRAVLDAIVAQCTAIAVDVAKANG